MQHRFGVIDSEEVIESSTREENREGRFKGVNHGEFVRPPHKRARLEGFEAFAWSPFHYICPITRFLALHATVVHHKLNPSQLACL